MSTPKSLQKPLSFLVVVLLLAFSFTALAAAESASAHDSLRSSSPADGETVTAELTQVTLTLSDTPMAGARHQIQVTDSTGTVVSEGEAVVSENSVIVDVVPATTGIHRVVWQVVSVDGHTISGEFAFTYAGPPASKTPPSAAPDTSAQAPDPAPAASDADENGGEGAGAIPIWAWLAVLLIILAIVTGIIFRRANRKSGSGV